MVTTGTCRSRSPFGHLCNASATVSYSYISYMKPSLISSVCHFGNIASFAVPSVKVLIPELLARPFDAYDILMPLARANCCLGASAWCHGHGRMCVHKPAHRHIGTFSCVGYSTRGSRLQSHDPSVVYAILWAAQRLLLEDVLVQAIPLLSRNLSSNCCC